MARRGNDKGTAAETLTADDLDALLAEMFPPVLDLQPGEFTASMVIERTGRSRTTVLKELRALVKAGRLEEVPQLRRVPGVERLVQAWRAAGGKRKAAGG